MGLEGRQNYAINQIRQAYIARIIPKTLKTRF